MTDDETIDAALDDVTESLRLLVESVKTLAADSVSQEELDDVRARLSAAVDKLEAILEPEPEEPTTTG